jgi:hypothetical protein
MAPKSLRNDPEKREKRIKELIERLKAKKHVQNRNIEAVLTPEQWADCNTALKEAEGVGDGAVVAYPVELDSYFELVKAADFEHVKMMHLLNNEASLKSGAVGRLSSGAESLYEHAQERLDEILRNCLPQQRSAMEYWLDRQVEYDPETGKIDVGLDPQSIPRKRGSRSHHAKKVASNAQTAWEQIRHVKLAYLNMALESLTKSTAMADDEKKEMEAKLAEVRKLTSLVRR